MNEEKQVYVCYICSGVSQDGKNWDYTHEKKEEVLAQYTQLGKQNLVGHVSCSDECKRKMLEEIEGEK